MKPLTGALLMVLAFAGHCLGAQGVSEPKLPEDLSGYRHIHSLTINDPQSPLFGVHHFYLNETGWETFENSGPYPYPKGTVFLGAVYKVQAEGEQYNEGAPRMYTMMRKDPSAEGTGGWIFAAFDPEGAWMEQDVKTACFNCHKPMKESDYVFSRPLGLKLPKP